MTKLLLLSLTFCGIAAAQTTTTYIMPAGNNCPSIEGCYYHNLTAKAADGSTVWGFFEAGGYWTQFQYQAFEGQNPGYKALFCNGTATWTTAAMDSGNTLYTMDCQASPDRTSGDPPAKIHAEIEAHSYVFTYVCGVKVRTKCHQTRWAVDAGTLAITN
jgi:hypothetical protein